MLRREPAAAERTQPSHCVACGRTGTRQTIQHLTGVGDAPLCTDTADCLAHCRKVGSYRA